jgi:hypothetical protein
MALLPTFLELALLTVVAVGVGISFLMAAVAEKLAVILPMAVQVVAVMAALGQLLVQTMGLRVLQTLAVEVAQGVVQEPLGQVVQVDLVL